MAINLGAFWQCYAILLVKGNTTKGGVYLIMEGEALRERLQNLVQERGASLFGVADLSTVKDYIADIYGEDLLHLDRAVVLGMPYPRGVVNQLEAGPTHTYLHYYKVLNTRLDDLALRIANILQDEGYEAFPIPASQRVTEDKLAGIFSHRLAGSLAGLGWIGRNCSLINPQYGPRLRLVTVLTEAQLPTDQPLDNKCGQCRACVEACPAAALTGEEFKGEDPLEKRFAAKQCDEYLSKVRVTFGKRICGRCLAVCPWGKKSTRRNENVGVK
ncbi:4Fe-4S double cluster binding domain-containing protein [Bacillota bacterium LX-D]|nr:4Fe-4S double cluster binding domain-containing protein [Bacillota bacterium LX-D]